MIRDGFNRGHIAFVIKKLIVAIVWFIGLLLSSAKMRRMPRRRHSGLLMLVPSRRWQKQRLASASGCRRVSFLAVYLSCVATCITL